MSVNGVTSYSAASQTYSAQSTTDNKKADSNTQASTTTESKTAATDSGVVYEPSANQTATTATKKYKPDAETIARLKGEMNNRKAQLADLVQKMLSQQANTAGKANGSIWDVLSSGNFTVDAATKTQAQADIAEDGYWGVSQTSSRILDFATALTGGDPDKIEEMRAAFEKGFKAAEKTWGGKLPDISQQTYSAVMDGFDKMKTDAGIE